MIADARHKDEGSGGRNDVLGARDQKNLTLGFTHGREGRPGAKDARNRAACYGD